MKNILRIGKVLECCPCYHQNINARVAIRPALRRTVRHLRPSSAIRHRPMPDKQKSSFCAIVQILIVSKGLTIDCKNPKPIKKYFTFFLRCLRFKSGVANLWRMRHTWRIGYLKVAHCTFLMTSLV